MDTRMLVRKLIRWTVVIIVIVVLAASLASFALHTYGAYRLEKARADFHSRWGHLTRHTPPAPVPDHENGARWLAAGGFAIVVSMEDQKFVGELSGQSANTWTDTQTERARWILHEQQEALRILLRTASFDNFRFGSNGYRPSYDEIHFLDIVKGLRMLTLEARLAWHEGRVGDSLAAMNAIGRAADGLLRTPVVMTWAIGSETTRWVSRAASDIAADPCADADVLRNLREILPSEDPEAWGDRTLAISIAEIAEEGLRYTDDIHDPSLGWSIPFWVSNRYLVEDLVIAKILERWNRYMELGLEPASSWPADAEILTWGRKGWPRWLAMTGTYTPNLLGMRARAQAASAELEQLELALDLQLASPEGLVADACDLMDTPATSLTGHPFVCRFDPARRVIVLEVPEGGAILREQIATDNRATEVPPIELPVGLREDLCPR